MAKFEKVIGMPRWHPPSPTDTDDPEPPQDASLELRRIARELGFDEATYVVSPRAVPAPDWHSLGGAREVRTDPHQHCPEGERRTGACWMRHR